MVQVHTQYDKLSRSAPQRLLKAALYLISNTLTTLAIAGLIIGTTPGVAFAVDAKATPQGGSVVAGSASFSRSTGSLIVNQKSQRAVIDWQSFNIGEKAKTEFKQPKATSLAVNRVTGKSSDPTQILGTLKSNGQIMVLDRNGVIFGKSARVDVGGITASTGSINVNQVMSGAGKIDITNMSSGTVANQGQITAKQGGLVALVAPHVANSGVISANLGRVELASGSAVTVDLYGDKLVGLAVNGPLANVLVENSGTLAADGGRVALTARAAQGVVNNVINTTGIIRANTIGREAGRIVLKGDDQGTVRVAGIINATTTAKTGTVGGRVDVTGNRISLENAQINVSGNKGGGEAYIGGGLYGSLNGKDNPAAVTDVSAKSVINADAIKNGNGGTVVVWGSEHTGYYGKVTSRGGATGGNGGLVEVSTGKGVDFAGIVDTTAAKGKVGQLLIDPATVSIGNGAELVNGTYLNAQNIANNLVFTSVIIQADNNIDILDNVDLSTSIYGIPGFDFSLIAPTFNLNKNMNMSAYGNFFLTANTMNLNDRITSGGAAIDPARVFSSATQANVLSNAASIQQAMDISSRTAPVTVQVSAGQYHENLVISKALTLRGNAGTADAGADVSAPEIFGTIAGGNIITVNANNVTIDGLHLNAQVGDGSVADSVNGVYASGVSNLVITQNTLEGFTESGISTPGSTVTLDGNLNILSPAQEQAANDAAALAATQTSAQTATDEATIAAVGAVTASTAQAAAEVAAATAAQAAAEATALSLAPGSDENAAAAQAAADTAAAAATQATAQYTVSAQAADDAVAAAAAAQAAADAAIVSAAQATAGTDAATAAAASAAAATLAATQAAANAAAATASAATAQAAADAAAASATAAQAAADAAAAAVPPPPPPPPPPAPSDKDAAKEAMKEAVQAFAHADQEDKDDLRDEKDATREAWKDAVQDFAHDGDDHDDDGHKGGKKDNKGH